MVEEHTQGSRASVYRLLNRMVELHILREERVKIQGQKCGLSPLSTAPSTTLRHEQDDADRCAIGFDNPHENSAARRRVPAR